MTSAGRGPGTAGRFLIVKVGGSLFDLPDLADRLHQFARAREADALLFLSGGGDAADVVRAAQPIHGLSDQTSHTLAIHAMRLMSQLLAAATGWPIIEIPSPRSSLARRAIVDPVSAFRKGYFADAPAAWSVTSDSLAALLARRLGADGLILLKSVSAPETIQTSDAVAKGWIDPYFPTAAAVLSVEWVNLRADPFHVSALITEK